MSVSKSRIKAIRNRDGDDCYYCGIPIEDRPNGFYPHFNIDHAIPKSRGGATIGYSNLRLSCIYCNMLKFDRTPEEFLAFVRTRSSTLKEKLRYLVSIEKTLGSKVSHE